MRLAFVRIGLLICTLSVSSFLGCSAASKTAEAETSTTTATAVEAPAKPPRGATIEIKPNSPADTVRAFWAALREHKFREALFLTNLRPAIEGLTDTELKEYEVDFASIAKYVPADVEINGEIVSGDRATVTAKLPTKDLDKQEVQQIELRKEGDVWIILTVDESAEKKIRREGKSYFAELKIESHQDDARDMLDRVAKAQMAYATTNQGLYGDMNALINAQFLPDDIRTSDSTGYAYTVSVSSDRRKYSATAVPAVYGKTGRLSFKVELDANGQAHLTSRDDRAGKKAK